MTTIQEALDSAIRHHQAGRLETAERIYRQILEANPDQADALHFLGLAFHQQGRDDLAVEYMERARGREAGKPHFHSNLGEVYRTLGRLSEAAACFQRALALEPDSADWHVSLGSVRAEERKLDDAIACFRRAAELRPDCALAHYNLGLALRERGDLDEAIRSFERAWPAGPDDARVHFALASALGERGRLEEAAGCYRRAIRARPDFAEAYNSLGIVCKELGKTDEAIGCFQRAVEYEPDFAEAHNNLGNARREQGKLGEALACFRRALECEPGRAEVYSNLGNAWKELGEPDEAIACYRESLRLNKDFAEAHSNLLYSSQFRPGVTLAELREAHAEFDRQHASGLRAAWRPHENARDPERRLRLGFVSPDLGRHPVGYLLVRALENLDREAFAVVCYSSRFVEDELTARFRAAAALWRGVGGWTDARLADVIRADRVDILFDLSGHTARNRLLVFARKPAPIQITWAGYTGTTGLAAMDYLLADRYEVPPGTEEYYTERVLWMPDGYVCYDPPDYAPLVGPLPALGGEETPQVGDRQQASYPSPPTPLPQGERGDWRLPQGERGDRRLPQGERGQGERGVVTFGSFNQPAKVNAEVVACWAEILRRLPKARLILKFRGLDDARVRDRIGKLFRQEGIGDERVGLSGSSPHDEFLSWYGRIDIALDPFPYSGGLTTCEALWMGVPVVTCPGETFAGRHSLSHLSNVGLTETIARDVQEYVDTAVRLAGDLSHLAALRAGLRERVARSPLCDGKRFAESLMRVLRGVWREYCDVKNARPLHGQHE